MHPWKIGDRLEIFDSFKFERIDKISFKDKNGILRILDLPVNSGGMGTIFYVQEVDSGRPLVVKNSKRRRIH